MQGRKNLGLLGTEKIIIYSLWLYFMFRYDTFLEERAEGLS